MKLPKELEVSSVVNAAELYDQKSAPQGFKDNSTYKVIIEGKEYPPKSIVAYAYLDKYGKLPEDLQVSFQK